MTITSITDLTKVIITGTFSIVGGQLTGEMTIDDMEPPPEAMTPPAAIRADQWTATHDLARGYGHRRIEIDPSVGIPDGWRLILVSNGSEVARPAPGSAEMIPGIPYLTKTPLKATTPVAYNSLWWRDAATGEDFQASENVIKIPLA